MIIHYLIMHIEYQAIHQIIKYIDANYKIILVKSLSNMHVFLVYVLNMILYIFYMHLLYFCISLKNTIMNIYPIFEGILYI